MSSCAHSASHDIAELKASLDTRTGPVQYSQLQAIMALQGLACDRSFSNGVPGKPAAAANNAAPPKDDAALGGAAA
eukprot:CAMPEP_0113824894 /NCGR_PEP_ID=MMETSP0328-20130328/3474_1 /TAXON_ID=39455 /ORGANISM="Alexandrium minutum" /LENGTH=75 /DNA_ID=CAMNT_0000792841 /DNA_START=74 /DNA_END=301 /DNA_ORIENTATION=- /assembly_acc=CAM_ASM_000350